MGFDLPAQGLRVGAAGGWQANGEEGSPNAAAVATGEPIVGLRPAAH
jgi:hypothetical protein